MDENESTRPRIVSPAKVMQSPPEPVEPEKIACSRCGGVGQVDAGGDEGTCEVCGGDGWRYAEEPKRPDRSALPGAGQFGKTFTLTKMMEAINGGPIPGLAEALRNSRKETRLTMANGSVVTVYPQPTGEAVRGLSGAPIYFPDLPPNAGTIGGAAGGLTELCDFGLGAACPDCSNEIFGASEFPGEGNPHCPTCGGSGCVEDIPNAAAWPPFGPKPCDDCGGSGDTKPATLD